MPIPGMRGTDHIGFTVPDLDEAERFLVDVLGAVRVYTLGAKRADDDFMAVQLGVHPRTAITEIRFYRLGNGSNLEVFHYDSADGQAPQPRNSDIGGHHLALYVDDMDAAIEYLRAHDVEIMGEPVTSAGASTGRGAEGGGHPLPPGGGVVRGKGRHQCAPPKAPMARWRRRSEKRSMEATARITNRMMALTSS